MSDIDERLERAAKALKLRRGLGQTPFIMAQHYARIVVEAFLGDETVYVEESNGKEHAGVCFRRGCHTYKKCTGLVPLTLKDTE